MNSMMLVCRQGTQGLCVAAALAAVSCDRGDSRALPHIEDDSHVYALSADTARELSGSDVYEQCRRAIDAGASSCSTAIAPGATVIVFDDRTLLELLPSSIRSWQSTQGWDHWMISTQGAPSSKIPFEQAPAASNPQ